MEATSTPGADRLQTVVAVLIAVVTLLGATVAWRAALAADEAGDADFAGLTAVLNAEQTRTLNNTTLYEHYRAFTAYLYHNELGNLIAADLDSAPAAEADRLNRQKTEAWDIATANQTFFPNRYLNRDGSYNVERELGETWAQAAQQQDVNPEPHFVASDRLRSRANWLIGVLIILAVALVLYTLAEGLNPAFKFIRFSLALGGTFFLLLSVAAMLAVEYLLR